MCSFITKSSNYDENVKLISTSKLIMFSILVLYVILHIWACNFGAPFVTHTDEWAIVRPTVDMLQRHSWIAYEYNRPDQFEIKFNFIIYSIYSYFFLGNTKIIDAYNNNPFIFHYLARMFTTFCGTILIVYSIKLINEFHSKTNCITSIVLCIYLGYSYIFMEHSSYATPDIPLSMFGILTSYYTLKYIKTQSLKFLIISSILIGAATVTKFPGCLFSFTLAISIIENTLFKSNNFWTNLKFFIKTSLISIFFICLTIFIIAPNIFTDIETVIKSVLINSNPTHLGADGLTYFGNLNYYFSIMIGSFGYISCIFFIIGIYSIVRFPKKEYLILLNGLIYIVILSKIGLHWLRWGIPSYAFYIIVICLGMSFTYNSCRHFNSKVYRYISYIICLLLIFICCLNQFLSGIAKAKDINAPQNISIQISKLNDIGVFENNSSYEAYTPFCPSSSVRQHCKKHITIIANDKFLSIENNKINYTGENKYLILSNFDKRYSKERLKYSKINKLYDTIKNSLPLVYEYKNTGNRYKPHNFELYNIISSLYFLISAKNEICGDFKVYKIKD